MKCILAWKVLLKGRVHNDAQHLHETFIITDINLYKYVLRPFSSCCQLCQ